MTQSTISNICWDITVLGLLPGSEDPQTHVATTSSYLTELEFYIPIQGLTP